MLDYEFYKALQQYLVNRMIGPQLDQYRRKKVMRAAANFVLKDHQLFYTGPSRQYMRLVVVSEEQKLAVLHQSHCNPDTGSHYGVRRTRDKVVSGYYWSTINNDVTDWVKSCQYCQLSSSARTVEQSLQPIKVTEAWQVAGMKIVGPLRETAKKNKYIFTLTDVYTKWVVAEAMQTKCVNEVSAILISKMYLFGMVRKIILDQGKEYVHQLNTRLFEELDVRNLVSSRCHSQTTEQDKHIAKSIMQSLKKCSNMEHEEWDLHLPSVVYQINTTMHSSTQYSPYYLMFHRHPLRPETINTSSLGNSFDVEDPEDDLDQRLRDINAIKLKVVKNLGRTAGEQKTSHKDRRPNQTTDFSSDVLDGEPLSENPKKCKVGENFEKKTSPEFHTQALKVEHSYSLSWVENRHEEMVD